MSAQDEAGSSYDPLAGWGNDAGVDNSTLDAHANGVSSVTYESALHPSPDKGLVELDLHGSPLRAQNNQTNGAAHHHPAGPLSASVPALASLDSSTYSSMAHPMTSSAMASAHPFQGPPSSYTPGTQQQSSMGPLSFGSETEPGPATTAVFHEEHALPVAPQLQRMTTSPAVAPGARYPALPADNSHSSHITAAAAKSIHTSASLTSYPQLSSVVASASSQQQSSAVVCLVGTGIRVGGGHSSIPGVIDKGHVEYPITSHTSLASWPAPVVTVHRRFRDFVSLSDALAAALPGVFLPARPHRSALGTVRGTPRFLEARRTALQRYLARLTAHPAACNSAVLQVFLQAQEPLNACAAWQQLKPTAASLLTATSKFFKQLVGQESSTPSPRDVTRPASQSGDVVRLLREKVAHFQGADKSAAHVTPLEAQLREKATQQEEVRLRLHTMTTAAKTLVDSQEGLGSVLGDLSKAMKELAQYEQKFGFTSGRPEMAMAEGASRAGELASGHASALTTHLLVLQEQEEAINMAQAALAARESALLTSATLDLDTERKRAAKHAAEATGPAGFNKVQVLGSQLSQLEMAGSAARDQYSQLAERNAAEMVAWQRTLQHELLAMVTALASAQLSSAEAAQHVWSGVATRIQQVQPVLHSPR